MYSKELLRVAKENGYEFKTSLKNLSGYCKVVELVKGNSSILVSRYSSVENFRRNDKDIINDIVCPINYESEFDKMFGIA